jgi:hypothetical protein
VLWILVNSYLINTFFSLEQSWLAQISAMQIFCLCSFTGAGMKGAVFAGGKHPKCLFDRFKFLQF